LWERVLIVLVKAAAPHLAHRWGRMWNENQPLPAWRRPFVVATHHPAWSAEMAAQAGASPLTLALIRRHQDPAPGLSAGLEDELLARLQAVDDQS
jgi:hypothetical protein